MMHGFPVGNTVTFSTVTRMEAREQLWDIQKNLPKFIKHDVNYPRLKTQICAALLWVFKGGKTLHGANGNLFEVYKNLDLIQLSNCLYGRFEKWQAEEK